MIKVDIKVKGDKHLKIDGVNADKVSLVKQQYETEHIVDTGTSHTSKLLRQGETSKKCCEFGVVLLDQSFHSQLTHQIWH
jgi:hypothetical protein